MRYHNKERKDKGEWEKKYLPYFTKTNQTRKYSKKESNRISKLKWKRWVWWNERLEDFKFNRKILFTCRITKKLISNKWLSQLRKYIYHIDSLYGEILLVNSDKRFIISKHIIDNQLIPSIIGEIVTVNSKITGELLYYNNLSAKLLTKESLVYIDYVWSIKRNLRQIE